MRPRTGVLRRISWLISTPVEALEVSTLGADSRMTLTSRLLLVSWIVALIVSVLPIEMRMPFRDGRGAARSGRNQAQQ